jgi:nitrilase
VSDFLAAALQLTSTSDIDANLNAAEEQIELAARRGADLVGLPENFAFLGEDQKRLKIASSIFAKCNSFQEVQQDQPHAVPLTQFVLQQH